MINFGSDYNPENLKSACNCGGTPLSYLKFKGIEELSLQDILWMWTKKTIYSREEESGLKFAWGKDLEFEDVVRILEDKYEAQFIKTKQNIDPIIVIDGGLYDGWKRAILAYALGQLTVTCAVFNSSKIEKPYIYSTEPKHFDGIHIFIKSHSLKSTNENHDGGIIFYFESEADKLLVNNHIVNHLS